MGHKRCHWGTIAWPSGRDASLTGVEFGKVGLRAEAQLAEESVRGKPGGCSVQGDRQREPQSVAARRRHAAGKVTNRRGARASPPRGFSRTAMSIANAVGTDAASPPLSRR